MRSAACGPVTTTSISASIPASSSAVAAWSLEDATEIFLPSSRSDWTHWMLPGSARRSP